jgi:AsmA protein
VSLPLGGKQPATLDGHFDAAGYSLHLAGNVLPSRLAELAKAVPQFGDGLLAYLDTLHPPAATSQTAPAAPSDSAEAVSASATEALVHVDLTATRAWGGPQHWQETASPVPAHTSRH